MKRADVVIVGAGAAGLWAALLLEEQGAHVMLVSRKRLLDVSSFWAQGGLAAVCHSDDSFQSHIDDTLTAGRGLCRTDAVKLLVHEAPVQLERMQQMGMSFDRADHELILGLEGGHSHRRIVHAGGSATGSHLLRWLSTQVEASTVEVLEGVSAWNLLADGNEVWGVGTDAGDILTNATVLATGGSAALWARTSNPPGSIGAGSVLAWEAGAQLADLEFCQFHPTALVHPGHRDGFLITEAIRGEGATLHGLDGERFVQELAPRDDVANAIIEQMRKDEVNYVQLDMTAVDLKKFPNVISVLKDLQINPARERLKVAPAAHYSMGGIVVDLHGQSSLPGLYAIGECSCTGLHGANRLASNSLSECFVWGSQVAKHAINASERTVGHPRLRTFIPPTQYTRDQVWQLAGPRRRPQDLEELQENPYPLAQMIATGSLLRQESRGPHQREDYPDTDTSWDHRHIIHEAEAETQVVHWD